jgi:hypothetical protein
MANDLSELLERIALCQSKIGALQSEARRQGLSSVECWVQPYGTGGQGEVQARLHEHPSVALRQEVGWIMNEQRSILDALACKLAVRNGINDTRQTYFPITATKEAFFKASEGQKKIAALSQNDRDAIAALKPWLPPEDDPQDGSMVLYLLHQADIYRKHNDLLRWACRGGVSPAGTGYVQQMIMNPVTFLDIGKKETLASFRGVTTDFAVTIEMVYNNIAHLYNIPVVALMADCNRLVERILQQFK